MPFQEFSMQLYMAKDSAAYEAKRRGPAPPSQIDQNIALIN